MAYRKLSEQVQKLSNPQRSDTFIKMFRNAVREGKFEAAYISERFSMPKAYSKRGSNDTYSKDAKEMIFDVTPAFDKWFEGVNRDLAASRRGGRIKPTVEAFENGLVDFKTLAAETRQKMEASFKKGQSLGKSRAKSGGTKTKRKSS